MAKRTEKAAVSIREMQLGLLAVPLLGRTTHIQHAFGPKAEKMLEGIQTEENRTAKPGKKNRAPKDIADEFVNAIHLLNESDRPKLYARLKKLNRGKGPNDRQDVSACFKGIRVGFPADGFKESCRRAVKNSGMAMTDFSASIWVSGADGTDLVEIKFKKVLFRRDHVRIGGQFKTTDLRYRPEFFGWTAVLEIEHDMEAITPQDIVNAISRAGAKCGIGEWRPNSPNKPGDHGRWVIDREVQKKMEKSGKKNGKRKKVA